jgi:hypothetical protein
MDLLRKIIGALSPTCRQAARLQSDALDRPLPPSQRFGLWFHLLICKWCRRYGRQLRFMRQASQEHPDSLTAATPTTLPDDARKRIKETLRQNS